MGLATHRPFAWSAAFGPIPRRHRLQEPMAYFVNPLGNSSFPIGVAAFPRSKGESAMLTLSTARPPQRICTLLGGDGRPVVLVAAPRLAALFQPAPRFIPGEHHEPVDA